MWSDNVAWVLATAFLAGSWTVEELASRAALACGKKRKWQRRLAEWTVQRFPDPRGITAQRLELWLIHFDGWEAIQESLEGTTTYPLFRPTFRPDVWQVPPLATTGELATWLDLTLSELDWFADRRRLGSKTDHEKLRHYRYEWRVKRGGGWRLLESPKPRLKELQRRILHEILDRIPPHEAAHGFRKGRSVRSFVEPHVGRRVVLKFDLRNCFPSVSSPRVRGVFMRAGYPEEVAELLTGLCCHVPAEQVWSRFSGDDVAAGAARRQYRRPHLPQGAPTSPALANLCLYRLDCRLRGFADKVGASYTRYADDLLFSGDDAVRRDARRLAISIISFAEEEGFTVNARKTRIMPASSRQRAGGLVLNAKPNVPRVEYERLKAILHNAARGGLESQNRAGHPNFRAHLAGRIAWVEQANRTRGAKLRRLLDQL